MMLPPSFIRIGFRGESRSFGLWLPVILLWPLMLLAGLLALAVSIVADIIAFIVGARYRRYTRLLFACYELLDATRGTSVFVDSPDTTIDFAIV